MSERLSKHAAINEALNIQQALYGWYANYLRSSKNFKPEEYKEAHLEIEVKNTINKSLTNLPTNRAERFSLLNDMCKRAGAETVARIINSIELINAPKSKEFQKFYDYSMPIFEKGEKYFTKVNSKEGFRFNSPSDGYSVMTYLIYKELGGEPYLSPRELGYNFSKLVRGKRILELAPGPGWFMSVLKQNGAIVEGIEKEDTNKSVGEHLGLNIHYQDINQALKTLEPESYDLVISNNLFSAASIKDKEEAKNIISVSLKLLKANGKTIHCNQHSKALPYELLMLLARQGGTASLAELNDEEFKRKVVIERPYEERLTKIDEEKIILEPSDIKGLGLKNPEFGREYHFDYLKYDK